MKGERSYGTFYCIKIVVFRNFTIDAGSSPTRGWEFLPTEIYIFFTLPSGRRFDSHLGVGSFAQRNLYLFYPFFFHSLFQLKPQPYFYRHWFYFAAKNNSSFPFEYQLWIYHCLLIIIMCSRFFIWLLLLVSPDGVEPRTSGSQVLGLTTGPHRLLREV